MSIPLSDSPFTEGVLCLGPKLGPDSGVELEKWCRRRNVSESTSSDTNHLVGYRLVSPLPSRDVSRTSTPWDSRCKRPEPSGTLRITTFTSQGSVPLSHTRGTTTVSGTGRTWQTTFFSYRTFSGVPGLSLDTEFGVLTDVGSQWGSHDSVDRLSDRGVLPKTRSQRLLKNSKPRSSNRVSRVFTFPFSRVRGGKSPSTFDEETFLPWFPYSYSSSSKGQRRSSHSWGTLTFDDGRVFGTVGREARSVQVKTGGGSVCGGLQDLLLRLCPLSSLGKHRPLRGTPRTRTKDRKVYSSVKSHSCQVRDNSKDSESHLIEWTSSENRKIMGRGRWGEESTRRMWTVSLEYTPPRPKSYPTDPISLKRRRGGTIL